jgi:malate dehydrogenase
VFNPFPTLYSLTAKLILLTAHLQINAGICATLAESIAEACPKAFILVISNPVNSTVPVFAEVLKRKGVFDPKR